MDHPAATLLHVDTFRGGIGRQQQSHGGVRVFELGLHLLELVSVHAAEEQPESVLIESLLKKSLFEEEQRFLVLREDDQPFVISDLVVLIEQVLS